MATAPDEDQAVGMCGDTPTSVERSRRDLAPILHRDHFRRAQPRLGQSGDRDRMDSHVTRYRQRVRLLETTLRKHPNLTHESAAGLAERFLQTLNHAPETVR